MTDTDPPIRRSIHNAPARDMDYGVEPGGSDQAKVTWCGGGQYVRHWQLIVLGTYIADTDAPHIAERYRWIVARINGATDD